MERPQVWTGENTDVDQERETVLEFHFQRMDIPIRTQRSQCTQPQERPPLVTFVQQTVPNPQYQQEVEWAKLRAALRNTIEDAPEESEADWSLLENKDWEAGPDAEWMAVHHTLVPPQPEPEMSAYSKRWQESFKKRHCPHGNRIYSPQDECLHAELNVPLTSPQSTMFIWSEPKSLNQTPQGNQRIPSLRAVFKLQSCNPSTST
jgi:hypothetical protein